jgi:hypothetical protein
MGKVVRELSGGCLRRLGAEAVSVSGAHPKARVQRINAGMDRFCLQAEQDRESCVAPLIIARGWRTMLLAVGSWFPALQSDLEP